MGRTENKQNEVLKWRLSIFFLPLSYHRYSLRILVQSFLSNNKSTCTLAEPGIEPLTFWLRNNLFFWGVCSCSTVITVGAHTLSPLQIFTQTNICQKNHSHHQKKKKRRKSLSLNPLTMSEWCAQPVTWQPAGPRPQARSQRHWRILQPSKHGQHSASRKTHQLTMVVKKRKEKERRARPPLWKHRDVWLVSWIIHFMDKCFICHFSKVTPKSSNTGLCIQQDNRHQSSSICRLMNVSPKLFKITWDFRAGNRRKVGTIFKQSTWTCHLLIFVLTFEANRQEKRNVDACNGFGKSWGTQVGTPRGQIPFSFFLSFDYGKQICWTVCGDRPGPETGLSD